MKKIILSAIAIFTIGFANAQKAEFGIKGGLNIASLTGDVDGQSSLVGIQIGGFAEFKISSKFAIQPELLFSTQGDKFNTGESLNLSYFNIPVMAKYYATSKFSLEFGPQIGILSSAKVKFQGQTEDFKEFFKSTDFGLNLGAGYDFTKKLSAVIRYNIGLSNIAKDSGNDSVHNSVFSLSLGYKF